MTSVTPIFSLSKSICSTLISQLSKCLSDELIIYNREKVLYITSASDVRIVSMMIKIKNLLDGKSNFIFSVKFSDFKDYINTSYDPIDFILNKKTLRLRSRRSEGIRPSSRTISLVDDVWEDYDYIEDVAENNENKEMSFKINSSDLHTIIKIVTNKIELMKFAPSKSDLFVKLLEKNNVNKSEDYYEIKDLVVDKDIKRPIFTFNPKYMVPLNITDGDVYISMSDIDPTLIQFEYLLDDLPAEYHILICPRNEDEDLNENTSDNDEDTARFDDVMGL